MYSIGMPLFIRQPMWWYNVPDTGPRDPRSILHPRGRHTGRRYQELNHRWGSRPLNKWPPTFSFRNNNIFSSSSILNHWYCILQSIGFTDILTSNQAFPIMYCWILVEHSTVLYTENSRQAVPYAGNILDFLKRLNAFLNIWHHDYWLAAV